MRTLFNFIPRLSWALSGSNPLRFLRLLVRLYWFALTRKFLPSWFAADFKVSGYFNKKPIVFWLRQAMEIAILVEMFVDHEYNWDLENEPKVILDLGAYIGDTALYYNAIYPNAKIYAVEPSPESFARLQRHVEKIPNITAINAAVGATDGEASFYLGQSNLGYSLLKREDSTSEVTVRQCTPETLCREHNITNIDLIKFDIEGIEFELFEKSNLAHMADAHIGEFHFQLSDTYRLEDMENLVGKAIINSRHLFGGRYLIKF